MARLSVLDDTPLNEPTVISAANQPDVHIVPRAVADRPILHDADGRALEGEALYARVSDLLARRRHWYESADTSVDGSGDPDEVVDRIVEVLASVGRPA